MRDERKQKKERYSFMYLVGVLLALARGNPISERGKGREEMKREDKSRFGPEKKSLEKES